jgi:hypothetical protein
MCKVSGLTPRIFAGLLKLLFYGAHLATASWAGGQALIVSTGLGLLGPVKSYPWIIFFLVKYKLRTDFCLIASKCLPEILHLTKTK